MDVDEAKRATESGQDLFCSPLGRSWLALGSSLRGDISYTVVGEKQIHMQTNKYINTVVSS